MAVLTDIVDASKNQEESEEISFESLPLDLIERCLTFCGVDDFPALSKISPAFRQLLASPRFYRSRCLLRTAEPFMYISIAFADESPNLHLIRRRRNVDAAIRRIQSLPPMPFGAAVVTIDQKMYIMGGSFAGEVGTSDVILIDCRTHRCHRSLPAMKVARFGAAAGGIDDMIYVIGGCKKPSFDWFEVLDPKKKTWMSISQTPPPIWRSKYATYAVMEGKIYAKDGMFCFAFDPKEGSSCDDRNELPNLYVWKEASCVVDGRLYTIDRTLYHKHPILVYDPKKGLWKPVRGITVLPANLFYEESKMVFLGGRLMILAPNRIRRWNTPGEKDIYCIEIALERREDGEIWGKIESVKVVLRTSKLPSIEFCRAVSF